MNKYELNGNIIETTETRYENTFKSLGYVPYIEKKIIKEKVEEEKITEKKKINKEK